MDFCPKCGSMILHGTKCGTCGFDSDGFYFEKLKIGIPNQYISDKNYLRENYDELLKLIVNRDEIKFTKNDLIQHLDKIINVANENFIKKERKS